MSDAQKDTFKDIEALSFEDALKELEEIVRKLESGSADLDASINDYSRGNALRSHCEKKLAEAKLKVEKIVNSNDALSTKPFDVE